MRFFDQLPREVGETIRRRLVAHYASVSAGGVPIDTPAALFTSADETSLDLATGLAYPAKAERARRNPKVGLLFEGGADEPVVAIAGLASVRDADLQANCDRYLAETVLIAGNTAVADWAVNRQAIWYYTRIFICITPVHVRWWRNQAAMDEPAEEWRAPAGTSAPPSDPAPAGAPSAAPAWPQPPWQELANAALGRGARGHLTLLDAEGFPIPIGARDIVATDAGFRMDVPAGAPWRAGKATLSFGGAEMFVGEAMCEGGAVRMKVERALPLFPLTADSTKVLRPDPDTRAALMARLEAEAARRGQSLPTMPDQPPAPTAGARYRETRERVA